MAASSVNIDYLLRAAIREELEPLRDELLRAINEKGKVVYDKPITIGEAADWANVNRSTIRDWIRTGRLRKLGEGKATRIKRDDLEAALSPTTRGSSRVASPEEQAAAILRTRRR